MQQIRNPEAPLFIGGPFHGERKDIPWGTNTIHLHGIEDENDWANWAIGKKPPWWRPFARARWKGKADALLLRPVRGERYRCEKWADPDPRDMRSPWDFGPVRAYVTRYFVHSSIPEGRTKAAIEAVHPHVMEIVGKCESSTP